MDIENMNGQENEQQVTDYQQPHETAANNEPKTPPQPEKAPNTTPDEKLELSDAEVASKSVEELDKLIQEATTSKAAGARKENAEPSKAREPEAPKPTPVIKVKTPAGEEREIKSLEEAQKYNGRLSNELGNSRKENEELKARLRAIETQIAKQQTPQTPAPPAETPEQKKQREQELQDKVLVDPEGVINHVIEKREAARLNDEQKKQQARLENVKFIKERHPEIVDKAKGMAIANSVLEYLAADGYTPEEINFIKRDPFGVLPPELLNMYIKIGKQQARIKELESSAATAGTKQQDIVQKINAAANGQSIIAKSGQGVPPPLSAELSDATVNSLSIDEIDKKINEYNRKV